MAAVPRETLRRLQAFEALLRRWNTRVNLVSPADLDVLWPRHIEDSLQLAPFLAEAQDGIDLGSGAGFPGLILAIVTSLPFTLVEADQRKAAFLREAARATKTEVTIAVCRIEVLRQTAEIVTARALAPLPRLLKLACPLLRTHGQCLFLKGADAPAQLALARRRWSFEVEQYRSHSHPDGVILRLHGIMPLHQQQTAS